MGRTRRNRAARRKAWEEARPEKIEQEFLRAMKDIWRRPAEATDVFGNKKARPPSEIADALHTGRKEQG